MSEHDGYTGPATLSFDGADVDVEVDLRGQFEPIDGRYHWYGRIAADERVDQLLGGRNGRAALRTPHGESAGKVSDQDTWGRYRITGSSTPPFAVPMQLDDVTG